MQKQDTHSNCTTVTKIDENVPPITVTPPSEELTQNLGLEVKKKVLEEMSHFEDDSKSRSGCELKNTKKCFNQRCKEVEIFKKVKSRVEKNRYRFLCQDCYGCYSNSQFCEFCEQIYGNELQDQDEANWVGCDNCERWNHITCQIAGRGLDFKTLQNEDNKYYCLKCVNSETPKKLRNGLRPRPDYEETEYQKLMNPKISQPKFQKVSINWKKEQFSHLDLFLNNIPQKEYIPTIFDFKLSLSDDLLKYDLNKLKNAANNLVLLSNKI